MDCACSSNRSHDMEVVGEAGNGRVALERAPGLQPHVIVLDLSMPEMNGLAATRRLRAVTPDAAVVALTRHTDQAYVQETARGWCVRVRAEAERLGRASAGGSRRRQRRALSRFQRWRRVSSDPSARRSRQKTGSPRITDREVAVLRMMAIGHSNKEIGASLDVSVKTVEVHKANAMRKLGLRGRIDVVRFALLQGWLQES